MNIQDIKKRYKSAYIEDFGDYEIVHVDKKELDWLIEQAEKVEKLQQQLDAKIMFVSNGNEEEMYALQERVIELETLYNGAMKAVRHLTKENEQLKKGGFKMKSARELLKEMGYDENLLNEMTDIDCENELQEIPYNL